MSDNPFNPELETGPPDEADRLLDLQLAALPRFEPGREFADRVMARVAVRRPEAALAPWYVRPIRLAPKLQALAAGMAGMAAATSTALTAWLAINFETLTQAAGAYAVSYGVTLWQGALALIPQASSALGVALGSIVTTVGPAPLAIALAALTIPIPFGMLGLYLAARPPLRSRIAPHAAR